MSTLSSTACRANHVYQDQQHNLWVCTDQGVYFLTELAARSRVYVPPSSADRSLTALALDQDGGLWVGSGTGELYYISEQNPDGLQAIKTGLPKSAATCSISDLSFGPAGQLLFSGNHLVTSYLSSSHLQELKAGRERDPEGLFHRISYSRADSFPPYAKGSVIDRHSGEVASFGKRGVTVYQLEGETPVESYPIGRTYAAAFARVGLWVGQPSGLYFLDRSTGMLHTHQDQHPAFSTFISHLLSLNDSTLAVGTGGRGILIYHHGQVYTIPETDGVYVNQIVRHGPQLLYAATNRGIFILQISGYEPFTYELEQLTGTHGLPSLEVNEVLRSGDYLYAATENGLCRLPSTPPVSTGGSPNLLITRVVANEREQPLRERYTFSPTENNLRFEFIYLAYEGGPQTQYAYRLQGLDTTWIPSRQRQVQYSYLPAGEYRFELRAGGPDGQWTPIRWISFTIPLPWYKTIWFISMATISVLGMVLLLARNRINAIRRRAQLERGINVRFAELELHALQSQMNPHFIFNALHSIQDFIFSKDEKAANQYIVKFSRLIRLVLESSKACYVSLETELRLLALYIELEQLRFDDQFDYRLELDPAVRPEAVMLPAVLIQPFVENAINHGLSHRKEPGGQLRLRIQQAAGVMIYLIEDNGIGRKRSKLLRQTHYEGYRSRGMELVRERVSVLNAMNKTSIQVEVTDIQEENEWSTGTRVRITIPKLLHQTQEHESISDPYRR